MTPKYHALTREADNIMDTLEQELEPEQMELVQTLITLYREIDSIK